ncbi:MAG: hypothetical protein WD250_12530 [Egibacteraceae bacterium]
MPPWADMIGFRDKLAHLYISEVSAQLLWEPGAGAPISTPMPPKTLPPGWRIHPLKRYTSRLPRSSWRRAVEDLLRSW